MRMPSLSTSARRLVHSFGLYLLAWLGVHPETVSLAAVWRQVLDALKAALGVSESAAERLILARAALNYADMRLDDSVRVVAAAARTDLGGRAEGPDWERLFHVMPGEVVRLPIAEEVAEVRRLEAEVASGAVWVSARARLADLAAARQGVEDADAERRAAEEALEMADRRLRDVVGQWRLQYRAIFGNLTERFPGKPELVEGFFYHPQDGPVEGAPTPTTPPAAPPATA